MTSDQSHDRIEPREDVEVADSNVRLWRYFSDRADALNDKLWIQVTWLLGLAGALIAYMVDRDFITWSHEGQPLVRPWPALVLGLVGSVLCLFGILLIWSTGEHIKRNWWRQGHFRDKVESLRSAFEQEKKAFGGKEIENPNKKPTSGVPPLCMRLLAIVAGFMIVFTLCIVAAVVGMVK
jgi:hypothetical protein